MASNAGLARKKATAGRSAASRPPVAPPVASAPSVTAAPAQILSRRHTHFRDSVLMGTAGVTGCVLADVASMPLLLAPGGILVAGSATTAVLGHRRKMRHDLEDRLTEALAGPLLGRSPDWRTVRCSRWPAKGWPGAPAKIVLRYAPGKSPDLTGEVLSIIEARLLATYKITSHDTSKCLVKLKLTAPAEPEAPKPLSYQRVEGALARQLPTSVVEKVEYQKAKDGTESVVAVELRHELPDKIANAGYRRRLESVMSSMHAGRWRGEWDQTNDRVRFEQRPELPKSVWLPTDKVPVADKNLFENWSEVQIPYAQDEDGRTRFWQPAKMPHWLMTGPTGTGKTSTVHSLVVQWTRMGLPAFIADGKSYEFGMFHGWPGVQLIAETTPEQVSLIHRMYQLTLHRTEQVRTGQVREIDLEPILFMIDEFSFFRGALLDWYADVRNPAKGGDPAKPVTPGLVMQILRLARSLRIHTVISMQRPDASFFVDDGRDNLPMRTSLGRLSPQGAQMMWQNTFTGVTLPRGVIGRAISSSVGEDPAEMQTYRFPRINDTDPDQVAMLETLRPDPALHTNHDRIVVLPPTVVSDEGDRAPMFSDFVHAPWGLAADHPGLDPLQRKVELPDGVDAVTASSATYVLLGKGGVPVSPPSGVDLSKSTTQEPAPDDSTETGEFAGYDEETHLKPMDLQIGDLVLIDEQWVTVDAEPDEDASDPDYVLVGWRSDDDGGAESVPADELLIARNPLEEESNV